MSPRLTARDILPDDADRALLVGRVWRDDQQGPVLVTVRDGQLIDLSATINVMADLLERDDAAELIANAEGESLGSLDSLLENSCQTP